MRDRNQDDVIETALTALPGQRLNRRQFVRRMGLLSAGLAALPVLAACGGDVAPQATQPPAGGAGGGAGAQATTAPAGGATATKAAPTPTAIAGIERKKSSAKVTGKLQILQDQDFHPDHNAFLRAEIEEYCKANGWDCEVTFVAGYQGGGDLNQKLVASVQAGNAPDVLIKDHSARTLHTLGVLEPVTDITKEMFEKYGPTHSGFEDSRFFENQWWAVPFFTRAGGMYVRKDVFEKAGLDVVKDTETYDKLRETALKISNPDAKMWGWGMTINRSGDGNSMVQNVLFRFGSHVQDETGQLVTFNSPETAAGLKWLKETYTDPKWANMLPPGVLSWTDPTNNEAFLAGTLGITDNAGTMYAKAVFDKVPFAKDIAYINRPKRNSDGKYLDSLGGTSINLIKGSKNKEAAYDLMRHLLSLPVQQQIWTISMGYAVPAYDKGWQDPIIQGNEVAKRAESVAKPQERFTGLRWPGPLNPAIESIGGGTFFTDMMAEVIQGKSAEDVAKDYHNRFVQTYKDFGLKGA